MGVTGHGARGVHPLHGHRHHREALPRPGFPVHRNAHGVFQASVLLAAGGGGRDALGRHHVHRVLQGVHKQAHVPHHGHGAAQRAGPGLGGGQHGVHQLVRLPHAHLVLDHLFQRGGAAAFGQA